MRTQWPRLYILLVANWILLAAAFSSDLLLRAPMEGEPTEQGPRPAAPPDQAPSPAASSAAPSAAASCAPSPSAAATHTAPKKRKKGEHWSEVEPGSNFSFVAAIQGPSASQIALGGTAHAKSCTSSNTAELIGAQCVSSVPAGARGSTVTACGRRLRTVT